MVVAAAVTLSGVHLRRYLDLLRECYTASVSHVIKTRLSRKFISLGVRMADEQDPCLNQLGAQTATIPMKQQKASYKSKASDNNKRYMALPDPSRRIDRNYMPKRFIW